MGKMGEQSRHLKDTGTSNAPEQEHDENDDDSMLEDEIEEDLSDITPEGRIILYSKYIFKFLSFLQSLQNWIVNSMK